MIFEHVIIIMRKLKWWSVIPMWAQWLTYRSEHLAFHLKIWKNIFHWTKLFGYRIWYYFFCPAHFLMKTYCIAHTDLLPWDRDTHRRVCLWKRTPCRQHWYHIPFLCMGLIQSICISYDQIVKLQDFIALRLQTIKFISVTYQ